MVGKHQRQAGKNHDRREEAEPNEILAEGKGDERREQQPPKVPLLSRGKDPTLAGRFEELMHGSPKRAD